MNIDRREPAPWWLITQLPSVVIPEAHRVIVWLAVVTRAIFTFHHDIGTAQVLSVYEQISQCGVKRRWVEIPSPNRAGKNDAGRRGVVRKRGAGMHSARNA